MKFSWKTTIGGISAVLAGISGLAGNGWAPSPEIIASIITGITLIFAKDHNVTGGIRKQ